jgi:hypothetical protein
MASPTPDGSTWVVSRSYREIAARRLSPRAQKVLRDIFTWVNKTMAAFDAISFSPALKPTLKIILHVNFAVPLHGVGGMP